MYNNNLPTQLLQKNLDKNFLIRSQLNYLEQLYNTREPIISVQEQRQTRKKALPTIINCKSSYTDKCYTEYNTISLRQGFGLLKDIRYEKLEPGKPSMVIHAVKLEKNQTDSFTSSNNALKELTNQEYRKRFALVHTETSIYIIGGYTYDPFISIRKKPSNDYKYDLQTNKLIPIQSLPNIAIGGNDLNNRSLSDCYYLTIRNSNETWIKLPNLPAPTSAPGIGVYNGVLHCVGGFDVLGHQSIAHGEYLILHYLQDKQWRYGPELNVIRIRPIVFFNTNDSIHGHNIYVAGGFNINLHTHKPYVVPDVQLFNQTTKSWQYLTTIPNLQLANELSYDDHKLHISETIERPNQMPQTNILYSFDLHKLNWINIKHDIENSRSKRDDKNVASKNSPFNRSLETNRKTEQSVFLYVFTIILIPIVSSFESVDNNRSENKNIDDKQTSSLALEDKKEYAPECILKDFLSKMLTRNRRASISRPYFHHWRAARENDRQAAKSILVYSPRLGKRLFEDDQDLDVLMNKKAIERENNEFKDIYTFLTGYLKERNITIIYQDSTKICLSDPINNDIIQEIIEKFQHNRFQEKNEAARERQLIGKHPFWFRYRLG